MNSNLINKLKELNILTVETKVDAVVSAKGIGDERVRVSKELVLTEVTDKGCKGYNPRDPQIFYPVKYSDIWRIGGMELDRLTKAYDLNVDGTKRKVGKKPGRKPKKETVNG